MRDITYPYSISNKEVGVKNRDYSLCPGDQLELSCDAIADSDLDWSVNCIYSAAIEVLLHE